MSVSFFIIVSIIDDFILYKKNIYIGYFLLPSFDVFLGQLAARNKLFELVNTSKMFDYTTQSNDFPLAFLTNDSKIAKKASDISHCQFNQHRKPALPCSYARLTLT